MSTPGDESRTEVAWREIVEHYGERPLLDDESTHVVRTPAEPVPAEDEQDDDSAATDDVPAAEGFRPPPPPPFPTPRTWQRGVAWAGILVAPALALLIGLLSIYVAPLIGWALVLWFVGSFGYLVLMMPRSPRDPWDDGSRI
ncbi:hypothetical protein [Nocardioides zhouii]|uniref:Uncharacterized protein n=1 Tax=Nocardioides zhouii TaxID=1168729 RepID=A0A4Q2SIC9_9ACTN|nr:hypothetical protein [Nocardioides zhouii]RYC05286.1 hypothetical protein EUA94_19610 [Nocardioides zhouii]